jgi:hypothetical protein
MDDIPRAASNADQSVLLGIRHNNDLAVAGHRHHHALSGLTADLLAAALAAIPALAAQDYPSGLFENSPVVPSGPPNVTAPS